MPVNTNAGLYDPNRTKSKQTYSEALAKDRDLYLLQRNKIAKLALDLVDRIGDRGQELAIKELQEYVAHMGIERD